MNFTSTGGDVGSLYIFETGNSVTGISGTIDGSNVTGLSGYASADQQFFASSTPNFTFAGLSFSGANLISYNLTNYPGNTNHITNSVYDPNGDGVPTPYSLTSFSVTAVPEPATWAMMLAGFGMIGFGMRSRKRHTVKVGVIYA